MLDVNLTALFIAAQVAAPKLKGGVLLVDRLDHRQPRRAPASRRTSPSKSGVIGLARALAVELAPDVRVNVINPGPANTPMLAGFGFDARRRGGAAAQAPDRARGHRRRRRLPGHRRRAGDHRRRLQRRRGTRPVTQLHGRRPLDRPRVRRAAGDRARAGRRAGRGRAPRARGRDGLAHAARPRAGAAAARALRSRTQAENARRLRDARHRQAALAGAGRRARDDPLPRVLRGLDRAPRRPPRSRSARTRSTTRVREPWGVCGADHPVELPAAGRRPLRRARARGGQRGDPQAVRAGVDHAAAARRSGRARGRAARDVPGRDRRRRDRRRARRHPASIT